MSSAKTSAWKDCLDQVPFAKSEHLKISNITSLVCFLVGVILWASLQPKHCSELQVCEVMYSRVHEAIHQIHIYSMIFLAPLLVLEITYLVISSSDKLKSSGSDLQSFYTFCDRWQSPLMMCVVLTVLMCTHIALASGVAPSHAAVPFAYRESWRPVYTLRYVEWSICVPQLLTLTGYYYLGRPMAEVLPPVIMTDAYILLSWLVFFVEDVFWCMALTVFSFFLYFWASYDMAMWCVRFSRDLPNLMPCFFLRVGSVLVLIVVFAWYGVIYLLALFGIWNAETEDLMYTCTDVAVKATLVVCFTVIRLYESRETLVSALRFAYRQKAAKMSILKGKFDMVMECDLESDGTCWLPAIENAEVQKLQHDLNTSFSKHATLNDVIANDTDKTHFKTYVLSKVNEAMATRAAPEEAAAWANEQQAVSQILNLTFAVKTNSGAPSKLLAKVNLSGAYVRGFSRKGLASAIVAIALLEPADPLQEVQGSMDTQILDEHPSNLPEAVPLLQADSGQMSPKGSLVCPSESQMEGESLHISATSAAFSGSEVSFALTRRSNRSIPRRSCDRKSVEKRNNEMQTDAYESAEVGVQTHDARRFSSRPPRPGSEILQHEVENSPTRINRSRSNSDVSNLSTGSNVTDFDGVWNLTNDEHSDIQMVVSGGHVEYSRNGGSLQQTELVLEGAWHLLGGPVVLSPDRRQFVRVGKAGSRQVFMQNRSLELAP